MTMKTILVYGGQTFTNRYDVFRALDEELAEHNGQRIIILQSGDGEADTNAQIWAAMHYMPCITHRIDLERQTYYMHQEEMIGQWAPDKIIIFPEGRETTYITEYAQGTGTPIRIIGA